MDERGRWMKKVKDRGGEYVVDVPRQSRHALANFLCYFVATYRGKRRKSVGQGR